MSFPHSEKNVFYLIPIANLQNFNSKFLTLLITRLCLRSGKLPERVHSYGCWRFINLYIRKGASTGAQHSFLLSSRNSASIRACHSFLLSSRKDASIHACHSFLSGSYCCRSQNKGWTVGISGQISVSSNWNLSHICQNVQ